MTLSIPLRKLTPDDMEDLERRGLVARLRPPVDTLTAPEGQFKAKAMYKTDARWGGHMLLFVNLNLLEGALNYHPGNEEVFLLNRGERTKPLIWVFALSKKDEIESKISKGTLSAADFVAYEMPFNNPDISCFTILAEAPHFEITTPGPEQSPYFWVCESSDLPRIDIDMGGYSLKVITS